MISWPNDGDIGWGTQLRTGLNSLENMISEKANANHVHSNYSAIGHNHSSADITDLDVLLAEKADKKHAHKLEEIIDIVALTADLSNTTPTVVARGLSDTSAAVILDLAGVDCLHDWSVSFRYNNDSFEREIRSQSSSVQIPKASADADCWDGGRAVMHLRIKQRNLLTGSMSLTVALDLDIFSYNYISVSSIVQGLESSVQFKQDLGTILANMVVLEAWQQQQS